MQPMFRQSQRESSALGLAKIILLILCSAGFATAEEFPRFELFAGYSLFNASAEQRHSFSGAEVNFKWNIRHVTALIVDAGGQYRSDPTLQPQRPTFFLNFHDRYLHAYQLFIGPEFTRRNATNDVFVHTVAGLLHGVARANGNNFAALGLGGGFVFHGNRKAGLRTQFDYIPNLGAGHFHNDFRLGTGIVLRIK
jgi:hypothetical protein